MKPRYARVQNAGQETHSTKMAYATHQKDPFRGFSVVLAVTGSVNARLIIIV